MLGNASFKSPPHGQPPGPRGAAGLIKQGCLGRALGKGNCGWFQSLPRSCTRRRCLRDPSPGIDVHGTPQPMSVSRQDPLLSGQVLALLRDPPTTWARVLCSRKGCRHLGKRLFPAISVDQGGDLASRGTLVMSGHIFGCHIWRQVTDSECGEAGDNAGTHPTTPSPGNHESAFCLCGFSNSGLHINGITQDVDFCGWLLSLVTMFSKFICIKFCASASFLFMAESTFYCVARPHFVHPFICGWTRGWFLPFGHCEQCCYEHGCTLFCRNTCLSYLG